VIHVLITGHSTRAFAASAVHAGFRVSSIDAFADLDLPPAIAATALSREEGAPFSARAAARLAERMPSDAVVYASGFEHDPGAVDHLAETRVLWGNPSSVLRAVRDPYVLGDTLRRRGFAVPTVWTRGAAAPRGAGGPLKPLESGSDPALPDAREWLVKPVASGGGRGVRSWTGLPVPRGCYLQQRVLGVPGSIVFAAAGGRAVPFGVTRQLIGDPAFGANGYHYCGNILVPEQDAQFGQDEAVVATAVAMAHAASEAFELVGVNGLDFVADAGVPRPVELNPRWCASMELVERAYGLSIFSAHAGACAQRALPDFDLAHARRSAPAAGKAIVFARETVTAGSTRRWLGDESVADIPHPGERIVAGGPICTVFAEGRDATSCYEALVRRAVRVYEELERT
jgi:predicted ATP-grasp superfamily ATP-dependent carboligase